MQDFHDIWLISESDIFFGQRYIFLKIVFEPLFSVKFIYPIRAGPVLFLYNKRL